MSDKITTLHLKNDPSTNVYPNVKIENIPLDVTIAQGGSNLATSGVIYDFANANFLSLNGGTMNGIITINDIGIPEKTILGDGVEVVNVSSQANVTTHYGSGYITQEDDEDTSIKYVYHFPKKSGTFITDQWDGFNDYAKKEDYPTYGNISEFTPDNVSDIVNSSSGYYEITNKIIRICGYINATANETSNVIFFKFNLPSEVGANISTLASTIAGLTNGSVLLTSSGGVVTTFAYLYKFSDTSFAVRFNNSYTLNGIYAFDIIIPYNA